MIAYINAVFRISKVVNEINYRSNSIARLYQCGHLKEKLPGAYLQELLVSVQLK